MSPCGAIGTLKPFHSDVEVAALRSVWVYERPG